MPFSQDLLSWFKQNKRQFPWRDHVNVYHTWVCEIMSQQTTLAVVLPRFIVFIKELPTVNSLATCSEKKLQELWAGLGYYARARNLKKGALYIVNECHSLFPETRDDWLKVPGCGPYTSAVIASICFKERVAAVDGNVIRVVSRILELSTEVWEKEGQKKISSYVNKIIPKSTPGDFNEAMMDLGATICKKQNPDCDLCPVKKYCMAYLNKTVKMCPPVKTRKNFISENLFVFILSGKKNTESLLLKRNSGFLSQTKGFPLLRKTKEDACHEILNLAQSLKLKVKFFEKTFTHTITHHKITCYVVLWHEFKNELQTRALLDYFSLTGEKEWIEFSLLEENMASSLDLKALKIFRGE